MISASTRVHSRSSDTQLATIAALRDKQRDGKKLTTAERAAVGAVMSTAVDALEIEGNEALRRVLKLTANDGKLARREQDALRDSLLGIGELADNPALAAELRRLRAQGSASDAEVARLKSLAQKLSIAEEDAVYASLMSLSLAKGVSEAALADWGTFVNDQTIARLAHANKAKGIAALERIGLLAALTTGFLVVTAVAPWASLGVALGVAGAQALQIGTAVGASLALRPAFEAVSKAQMKRIASYGVND